MALDINFTLQADQQTRDTLAAIMQTLSALQTDTTDIKEKLDTMATTQAQFDADQQLEDTEIKTLITETVSLVTGFQALQANPAVVDLTNEDTDAKTQLANMAAAVSNIQGILTPAPATGTANPATGTANPATGTANPATGTANPATGTAATGTGAPPTGTTAAA